MSNYRVLLYYKYVTIDDPEQFKDEHLAYCKNLGLKGRIYVSREGINGTVSGTIDQTSQYMEDLTNIPGFEGIDFKIDEADQHVFKKMKVKHRREIVSLHLEGKNDSEDVDPNTLTGRHLEPGEFREALLDEDVIVLDARNDYEYDVGHFRGALRPDIKAFHELPQWIKDNKELFMDKKVVTYCTGGIRCEKLSGWMLREGIETAQLKNGIHNYSTDPETQGDLWDGVMYVFDDRLTVPVNQHEHVIVGKDWFDGQPCERYVNCANPQCNEQFICSEENEDKYLRGCSEECRSHPDNRYVKEHHLTLEEWQDRLEKIGEEANLSHV